MSEKYWSFRSTFGHRPLQVRLHLDPLHPKYVHSATYSLTRPRPPGGARGKQVTTHDEMGGRQARHKPPDDPSLQEVCHYFSSQEAYFSFPTIDESRMQKIHPHDSPAHPATPAFPVSPPRETPNPLPPGYFLPPASFLPPARSLPPALPPHFRSRQRHHDHGHRPEQTNSEPYLAPDWCRAQRRHQDDGCEAARGRQHQHLSYSSLETQAAYLEHLLPREFVPSACPFRAVKPLPAVLPALHLHTSPSAHGDALTRLWQEQCLLHRMSGQKHGGPSAAAVSLRAGSLETSGHLSASLVLWQRQPLWTKRSMTAGKTDPSRGDLASVCARVQRHQRQPHAAAMPRSGARFLAFHLRARCVSHDPWFHPET